MFNTEFWIDPVKHIGAVQMMQLLPFTRVAVKPRPSGRGYKATIHSGAFCDSMY